MMGGTDSGFQVRVREIPALSVHHRKQRITIGLWSYMHVPSDDLSGAMSTRHVFSNWTREIALAE
jgi:hypothetical protein